MRSGKMLQRPSGQLYWPTVWTLRTMQRYYGQTTVVEGRGNLPSKGGYIIVPKHLSNNDPPLITVVMRRMVYFMGKIELFHGRLKAFYYGHSSVFPVNRADSESRAIAGQRAIDLARAGEIIGIFPEGERTPTIELGELDPGAIIAAMRANVPLVPIGILYDSILNASVRRRGQKNVVVIGKPTYPDDLKSLRDRNSRLLLLQLQMRTQMTRAGEILLGRVGSPLYC